MPDSNEAQPANTALGVPAPIIYQLKIDRFRGIKTFSWNPGHCVNLILGGGDVGKTTILDAIGLLLSPANSTTISDTDYFARDDKDGFVIQAFMSIPPSSGIHKQTKANWPWRWNGQEAVVPSIEGEDTTSGEPVFCVRVRGTEDLDLVYEIVQPDGDVENFSVALRRALGLVRLGGDDRNDRDLRLVQGSALDRLLSDKGLRSRLTRGLADTDVKAALNPEAQKLLIALDGAFKQQSLPADLDLAITGSQGLSITALIGVTAKKHDAQLPVASWGAGTRRLAALAIAEQNQGECPISLVDEIERGLEPYRQRSLMLKLQTSKSQAFVTTHSPFAISAISNDHTTALWYVDHAGRIGPLEGNKVKKHRVSDPETFLSRIAIVAEGITEVGFVSRLVERALGSSLEQHGVHVSDGGGHENTLYLLEALSQGGLLFAGFADNEGGMYPTRWQRLQDTIGALLFRWTSGCLEENVISVTPEERLEALVNDPKDERTGYRLRTLAERLGIEAKDFGAIKETAGTRLRSLMCEAATGKVPEDKSSEKNHYKAHAQSWFKTKDGGRELAEKLTQLEVWQLLAPQLMPFLNALRRTIGLSESAEISP